MSFARCLSGPLRTFDTTAPARSSGALRASGTAAVAVALLVGCGDDGGRPEPGPGSEFLVEGDVEPGCSTGVRWTGEDFASGLMHPGGDCNGCHATATAEDVPEPFTVAGTVHSAVDDADDCAGVAGVTVRVIDATGKVVELITNAAGNFYTDEEVAVPYLAEVELGGEVAEMDFDPADGNCTTCHTQTGIGGAPGRITTP